MRKRDRLEIIHDILKTILDHNNSILPTRLLRYSNLSSQSFNEYIAELVAKGFVREVYDKRGRKYYSLTDKGFRFIEKYQKIREFIEEFGLG